MSIGRVMIFSSTKSGQRSEILCLQQKGLNTKNEMSGVTDKAIMEVIVTISTAQHTYPTVMINYIYMEPYRSTGLFCYRDKVYISQFSSIGRYEKDRAFSQLS